MGWLYYAPTLQSLVNDLLCPPQSDAATCAMLASRLNKGSEIVLWSVVEVTAKDDSLSWLPAGQTTRLINCDLIECYQGQWGVKRLGESSHPFYYCCPLAFLEMTPVACQEWRDKVRLYHKSR